jgi:carboxymethylenebutenolidase
MNILPSFRSRSATASRLVLVCAALVTVALAQQPAAPAAPAAPATGAPAGPGGPGGGARGGGGRGGPTVPPIEVPWNDAIPPGTAEHAARALAESTRKGEWVDIAMKDGTKLRSWVTHPAGTAKAGVVLVIHDIRGMADSPRAVGDQLAQDGFISIVPDFLSGKGPNGGGTESLGSGVGQAIQALTDTNARLDAAMEYGKTLARSNGKTGVVGFCWGGAGSINYAAHQPNLNASVIYYGNLTLGEMTYEAKLANVKAPVLGLYAGNDMRINATVPPTEEAMKKLGKSYEIHTFEGAGHGFMSSQAGAGGANLKAAVESWPKAIAFFRQHLN